MSGPGGKPMDFDAFDPGFDRDFGRGVDVPDLSDRILASVDEKRAFLPGTLRRAVSASRLAIGGAVALLALGAAALYNINPDLMTLRSNPAPLTRVVRDAGAELNSANSFDALDATVNLTRHALPHYIPSTHELAVAAAEEGLSTLGAPGECGSPGEEPCSERMAVLTVTRGLPCDSGDNACSKAILMVSPSMACDVATLAATERVVPTAEAESYVP